MAEKSSTNVYWYVIFAFILVMFVSAVQLYTDSLITNPEIELSNESINYIAKLKGINLSDYRDVTASEIEDDQSSDATNQTGSQAKDFALEFFYSRSQASKVGLVVKGVYSFPSFITTLLNIPDESVGWLIDLLNWFWRIALLIAVYYFIRGITT